MRRTLLEVHGRSGRPECARWENLLVGSRRDVSCAHSVDPCSDSTRTELQRVRVLRELVIRRTRASRQRTKVVKAMEDESLIGQVALVTGASTGIGRELAEAFAARGATVAGIARGAERLAQAMKQIAEPTGARTLEIGRAHV